MGAVEAHNPELRDVLPTGYQRLEKSTLIELLRLYASAPLGLRAPATTHDTNTCLRSGVASVGPGQCTRSPQIRVTFQFRSRFGGMAVGVGVRHGRRKVLGPNERALHTA